MRITWLRACIGLSAVPGAIMAQPISTELGRANFHELPAEILPEGAGIRSLGQLPDGRMLWGGESQVFIYDGQNTEIIQLPIEDGQLTQTEATPDGRILIATNNYAAVAHPDGERGWILQDWPRAKESITAFKDNFRLAEQDGVLLATNARSGAWLDHDNWIRWELLDRSDPTALADSDVYIQSNRSTYRLTQGRSQDRWTEGRWQPDRQLDADLPKTNAPIHESSGGDLQLFGPRGQLHLIDAQGRLKTLTPADANPRNISTRDVAWFTDGASVVSWTDSSISIQDPSGRALAMINESNAPAIGNSDQLFVDQPGNVWISSRSSIGIITLPRNVTRFDRTNGLDSPNVLTIIRYQQRLYVGTDDGIFRLNPGSATDPRHPARFQKIKGPSSRTPTLLIHNDQLYVGMREGVYQLQGDQLIPIGPTDSQVTTLATSSDNPDRIYIGSASGTLTLDLTQGNNTSVRELRTKLDQRENTTSILEYTPGSWLIQSGRNTLIRLEPGVPAASYVPELNSTSIPMATLRQRVFGQLLTPTKLRLVDTDGLTLPLLSLARWADLPLIVSERGLHSTDLPPQPLDLFDPETQATLHKDRRLRVFAPHTDTRAWLALAPSREAAQAGLGWQLREVAQHADAPLRILPAAATDIGDIHALLAETTPDEREILWVTGEAGLLRIDLSNLPPATPPVAPRLTTNLPLTKSAGLSVLATDHASFAVSFSAPMIGAPPVAYRSRLINQGTGEWTAFSPDPHREIGYLPPGDYRLEAQARNVDGLISPTSSLNFSVPPPWWATPWARVLALLCLILAFGLALKALGRRQLHRQQQLENLVNERTAALLANERLLSLARDQAESASRAKSAFLASMSHELRTPLNAILGFAHILRREPGITPKGQHQLEVIDRNGKHLLETINEVLDLSKVEAEKITLRPAACSLARLLSDLVDLLGPRAEEKGLTFRLELGPQLPPRVRVDITRLRQVLINLLGNAIKFTNVGGITLRCSPGATGRLRFSVSDTGSGIMTADQATIFLPFQQATGVNRMAGSGLGLTISQRIIEAMDGRIQVTSTLGKGSDFHFEIPLIPAAADSHSPFSARTIVGYTGPRRRLLAVDDEAINLELLVELLTPLGFLIETVPATADAEIALQAGPMDAVLIDIRMPDEDGLAFVQRYRRTHPVDAPPFIAVSASIFESDRHEAIAAGCRDFLAKPINLDTLLDVLGRLLALEWLTEPAEPWTSLESLPRPSPEIIHDLLTLARAGDLAALRAQLAGFSPTEMDPRTASHLDQLAADFKTAALRDWLTAAGKPPHRA